MINLNLEYFQSWKFTEEPTFQKGNQNTMLLPDEEL